MDLSKILNIVRRYLWLFVLAPLVASLTTLFVVGNQPTSYRATTRLLVGPSLESPSLDVNSLRIGGQLIQTYAELVQTRSFLESVNNKLEHKSTVEALNTMIATRQNIETRLLTIIVYHPDPNQAVAIAKAAAETYIEMSPSKDNTAARLRAWMSDQSQQLEQIATKSEATIQQLETQLAELKSVRAPGSFNLEQQALITRQLADERAHWADALGSLETVYQMLLDTNTNQIEIIEPAGTAIPVSKDLPLRAAASGVAGLILAVIVAFAFDYFDDTIRTPHDFSRATKVPLLSRIEKHNRLDGSGLERVVAFAQPQSRAANSYRTAVSKLLFSIGESTPYTFLLSSVGSQSGDDTATATVNLAVAFAQAGNRVIVVDAQSHNPILTKLFNAGSTAGLSDLLITNSPEIQLIPVNEVPGFRFLPAGLSSEKGSAAALNPTKIVNLVEELQREADIVLIAGSPISWSAESLTLASQVKGVILVTRQGEARTKIVSEVVESLNLMNVKLSGIIFDDNPSPFISKQNLKIISAVARVASKVAISGNLKTTGQVDVDTTRPPDLEVAALPADENTELTSLDRVGIDTIQPPDMGNLPMPTDEIEVSNLVTVDVDPVPSPNLTDSITSVDDLTSLEEVAADPIQTSDLEDAAMPADEVASLEEVTVDLTQTEDLEPAALPADENTEMSTLDQVNADTMQSPDLAGAATSFDENLELLPLDRVEVDSAHSPDLRDSVFLAQENLELALMEADAEKAKVHHSKNSNGSRMAKPGKRNRRSAVDTIQTPDLEDAALPAEEKTELPDLGQGDAETIQSPELADAATSLDENRVLPDLAQVDVDPAQSPDLHPSPMLSEENLELALIEADAEKAKVHHSKNSNGSRMAKPGKRNRRS